MGSFKTVGKLFNMNRKADLCLLAGIMKSVGKKDAASIRKKPDGFINVQTPFDKENGIIRYKFTQCPNAEFAKKHGFPLTNALSTGWISLGNIWMMGGLLVMMPKVEKTEFEIKSK